MREKRQHPRAPIVTVVHITRLKDYESDPTPSLAPALPSPTAEQQDEIEAAPLSAPLSLRSHERRAANLPALRQGAAVHEAESRDISIGGMFLSGATPTPIGTEVVLSFQLPGFGEAMMPAYVRWSTATGFGVQFGLIGARETHAIGRLLRAASQPDSA